MALTKEKRLEILVDLLFKDVAAGKAASSEFSAYFEEFINSKGILFPSRIAADEESIPHIAQAVPNVIEEIIDLVLIFVPGTESRAFYHEDLVNIIPFNFGDGSSYLYQLKKQDDSPIHFGEGDWFFNPNSGVLYFLDGFPEGVSPSQPPKISCFKYIGDKGVLSPASIVDSLTSTDPKKLLAATQGPIIQNLIENANLEIITYEDLKLKADLGQLTAGKSYQFPFQTQYIISNTVILEQKEVSVPVTSIEVLGDTSVKLNFNPGFVNPEEWEAGNSIIGTISAAEGIIETVSPTWYFIEVNVSSGEFAVGDTFIVKYFAAPGITEVVLDENAKPIVQEGGVLNTDVHNGTPYGDMTADENTPVSTENIVVTAISPTELSPIAYSRENREDILYYDLNDNICEDGSTSRKGWIKRRINTTLNINLPIDWRVVRYRRWSYNFNLHKLDPAHSEGMPTDAVYNPHLLHGVNINSLYTYANKSVPPAEPQIFCLDKISKQMGKGLSAEFSQNIYSSYNVLFGLNGTAENFPNSDYWIMDSGWTIVDNKASHSSLTSTEKLIRKDALIRGVTYKLRMTLNDISSGSLIINAGSNAYSESAQGTFNSDGTYELDIVCDIATTDLLITSSNEFVGEITEIGAYPLLNDAQKFTENYLEDIQLDAQDIQHFRDLPIIQEQFASNVVYLSQEMDNLVFNPYQIEDLYNPGQRAVRDLVFHQPIKNVTFLGTVTNSDFRGRIFDSLIVSNYFAKTDLASNATIKNTVFLDLISEVLFKGNIDRSTIGAAVFRGEFSGIEDCILGGFMQDNTFRTKMTRSAIVGLKYFDLDYTIVSNDFANIIVESYIALTQEKGLRTNTFLGFLFKSWIEGKYEHITVGFLQSTNLPNMPLFGSLLQAMRYNYFPNNLSFETSSSVNVFIGNYNNFYGGAKVTTGNGNSVSVVGTVNYQSNDSSLFEESITNEGVLSIKKIIDLTP